MSSKKRSLSMILAGATVLLAGCTQGTPTVGVYRGAVRLDSIKVDTPEKIFQDAIVTFVQDPSAHWGGTQYLSRTYDPKGGQYIVSCMDGTAFKITVLWRDHPVSKDYAFESMKALAPIQSNEAITPEPAPTGKNATPMTESFTIGKHYRGSLHFADADHKTVVDIATEMVKEKGDAKQKTES